MENWIVFKREIIIVQRPPGAFEIVFIKPSWEYYLDILEDRESDVELQQ